MLAKLAFGFVLMLLAIWALVGVELLVERTGHHLPGFGSHQGGGSGPPPFIPRGPR